MTKNQFLLHIHSAAVDQKPILRQLLELYLYDLSEFNGEDVNAGGRYEYTYLDHYWVEEGRHPFLFYVGEKLAGLALVREKEDVVGGGYYLMAEFFVQRKYRRHGVGREAARGLFTQFPGRWRVAQEAVERL